MGTYPPRECGIATFNQDLLHSAQHFFGDSVQCLATALNFSPLDTHAYPPEVVWQIDQKNKLEYKQFAMECNNNSQIGAIILQHEYGIFGGQDGEYILHFLEHYTKPVIVALHTVLPNPSPHMRLVTNRIVDRADKLIVLTDSTNTILAKEYPHSIGKTSIIPHGIHFTPFSTPLRFKRKLKLESKTILTTFGLMSRGKGIEYVLRALPAVVAKHPTVLYLILGETHPIVQRSEGEKYRKELIRLTSKLQLTAHVKFFDQYLSLEELLEYLKASDIYLSTSINPDQVVSGTLSYALGSGRAVVSTAFSQAKEIIQPSCGRLVPIKNSAAFSEAINELLENHQVLMRMHKNAYKSTRSMLWSSVAKEYALLLTQIILPPLNLTHFKTMTDDFGMFQFAHLSVPNKTFGYTLDDNARALVVCCTIGLHDFSKIQKLVRVFVRFIATCQQGDGGFINYISYKGKIPTHQNKKEDLEDALSRAMWGLSEALIHPLVSTQTKREVTSILLKAMPHAASLTHLRSKAFMIKAFANLMQPAEIDFNLQELSTQTTKYSEDLLNAYESNSTKSWRWFENALGYNNGVIPEALLVAYELTGESNYKNCALSATSFLVSKTFSGNRYLPVGQSHWYTKNRKRSVFDQQPEEPASNILLLAKAYEITHDSSFKNKMKIAFSWFLGNNSLHTPLYTYENGGCFDGLHPDRVNLNQGAESLVSYLLSRAAIANSR